MPHVSLITLGVSDLLRATTFYEALGWHRSSASVDGVVSFLEGGNVALGLFGHDALAEESGLDTPPSTRTGSVALATNVASEAEVNAVLAAAEHAGGRVTRRATRADWGGWSGYFTDPDGHLWEVANNPGFPLDADGRIHLPR
ncbi:MAG: VOC family protein [Nitriliruptoraceae bacterium]